jgi:hypothetical protein
MRRRDQPATFILFRLYRSKAPDPVNRFAGETSKLDNTNP